MTPGEKIVLEAMDAFVAWEHKWAEDLDDIATPERAIIYSYMLEGIDIDTAKMMAAKDR